jgi:hypothetical protein
MPSGNDEEEGRAWEVAARVSSRAARGSYRERVLSVKEAVMVYRLLSQPKEGQLYHKEET